MANGEHCVKNPVSSSYGLGFVVFLSSEGKGGLTQSVNDGGVCRTAPATQGQLIIVHKYIIVKNKNIARM